MAERLKNITGLFKEGRTRIILLTTMGILLIAIIVGFFSIRGRVVGGPSVANVSQAPGNISSVPFEAPNEEYARLQEKQNVQQAHTAEQLGTSAIPTIVRSTTDAGSLPDEAETGVGFTALSREQSDAGTFSPKAFGADQKTTNCVVTPGTPVYDAQGRLIGYVGADGKVRAVDGNVIGSVDPDGTVREAKGGIIGKVAATASTLGTPVYDKNGRLIGYVGADGKVRDLNGNIIGTVGPDGLVRDANGNIIGQVSGVPSGTPVYDDKGNLIGTVGADGKVRDATGRIIGTVGPDGLVRDASGKIIGQVGKPVYDADGKLLGFLGPDGKIRDANGNIIGTVGADGIARDLNGNIIGKAGAIPPGTPIYDNKGNLIGYLGPDGKVRDANGNIIGTMGVDGLVRDANGNVIGSTHKTVSASPVTQSQPAAVPQSGTTAAAAAPTVDAEIDAEQTRIRQQALLTDQRLQQQVQQKQQAMAGQASQLLIAWSSPTQQFVPGEVTTAGGEKAESRNEAQRNNQQQNAGNTSNSTAAGPVFIKAGTVLYAVINTSVNSDEPGPVMATVIGSDYSGARLLGTITNQGKALLLTFDTFTMPAFARSIGVNAVAIDQNTARTALSTYTDNHYLLRYGMLFASSFIQGYGQAYSQSGSTTSSTGLTVQTTSPDLTGAGKFYVALGNVGAQLGNQTASYFNTPPTVYIASGTPVGVLFMKDVQLPVA